MNYFFLGGIQAFSSVANRKISLKSMAWAAKYYPSKNTKGVAIPGLLLPLEDNANLSFLPVVDGYLVGRGHILQPMCCFRFWTLPRRVWCKK
jgi:hypothetical protein